MCKTSNLLCRRHSFESNGHVQNGLCASKFSLKLERSYIIHEDYHNGDYDFST